MMDGNRMGVALEYFALVKEKTERGDVTAAKTAAEEVGTTHKISARTVERYVREFRETIESAKEWVHRPVKS
jgi:hypothetical protein